ncbi:TlpA family protein disulfide reductase [Sphingobacterium lumbrici]|uniref:TlpA family protein disulfide reductase n=1 Tax=Sphingobacterium lumbrici TaxID=2559600 RepID=UPI00112A8EAD|nr:TlpA disulfide reductase family protein [Sphingobacterium lumbrici]
MMKGFLGIIVVLFTLAVDCLYAQVNKATINITVVGNSTSGVNLYRLKDGRAISLGFQRPDTHGKCAFELDEAKEGIYFFAKAGGKGSDYKYVIYLKAGDQKQVELHYTGHSVDYDSCVVHDANVETHILQKWTDDFNAYCRAVGWNIPESYPKYEAFAKHSKQFVRDNKTKNIYFNTWLADKIDTDLKYLKAANFFYFGRRLNSRYDSTANVAAFYRDLDDKTIVSNPALLRSEHGQDLLHYVFAYWEFNKRKSGEELAVLPFSKNVPLITNNDVKVAYLLYKMPDIKEYEVFKEQVEPFQDVFISTEQREAYQRKYEELYLFAKGAKGYNFKLKDAQDREYSLDSFKGKVLIIDMWAMWCAPCLAEKPIMEKIAEEYSDRDDVAFVGVSVDGLHRKDIWSSFIKKKGFTSIELLSNSTESIQKYYRIEGIPRFLIFDKEGRIVTVDAPRPSTPGFKKIIDDTLGVK